MPEPFPLMHVLRDPPLDGPTNMARDEYLLYTDAWRPAVLRMYGWHPATLSLGCFQRVAEVDDLPEEVRELPLVRRPTGGGAILHDREVTYCLSLDYTHPLARQAPTALYALAHRAWCDALREALGVTTDLAPDHLPLPTPRSGPFFCFAEPGRTDLLLGERKLLGSAQRRLPGRVIQHGSLMLDNRFRDHPVADLGDPPSERVERLIEVFIASLAAALNLTSVDAEWSDAALHDANERRERFASEAWTCRR